MAEEPLVFISYASPDVPLAGDVAARLKGEGISCFFAPADILAGWWPRTLVDRIHGCRVMLLILSGSSNRSEHVYREVALAAYHRKQLVTFQIFQEDPLNELEYFLSARQMVQASTTGDAAGAFR